MYAMSHRSDLFLAGSSRVDISEPASNFTIILIMTVSQVQLPSFESPTATSYVKYLNTSLMEGMISSKNEGVFICDLSDLTSQILFDSWLGSMNVGSKHPIAWNDSRYAMSWQVCLNCRMDENGSTGIKHIVFHQVLRHLSVNETSSMGKHLLAKSHIANLTEITELEVSEFTRSMVDGTDLTTLKIQGS